MRNGSLASHGHVKGIDATNDRLDKEDGHKKKPIISGKIKVLILYKHSSHSINK
jgi:hypothetical protein